MQPLKRSNTIVTNSLNSNLQKRNSITDRIAMFSQKPKDNPIKEKKPIKVDNSNMKKRIEDMKKNNQKAEQTKKLNSQYYEVEKFNTNNVRRMSLKITNIDIQKKLDEERKMKEIKEKKIVNNKAIKERIQNMEEEKRKEEKLKSEKREKESLNVQNLSSIKERINTYYSNVEKTCSNFKSNVKLKELNEKMLKNIFGEKQKDLSEEQKLHLFDRKINNYEIQEKVKYEIKLKNPNEKIKYQSIIYDEDGNILKTSEKKEGKNEIILFDNLEMNYNFTKSKLITMELVKYIDNNEVTRTKKVIPLKKIFHPEKKEYEEKIENFTDNELLNIDYGEPNKKEDENYVQLSFNTDSNKENDSKLSYSIQKNNEIIFKSAICNCSNIKKTDKIPESMLKPDFEISFYNSDFEEKRIKVNYSDLLKGGQIIKFEGLGINVLGENVKKNSLIKLIKKGLNLDLSIAIDFTGSNGWISSSSCLHYIENGFVNNYEKAIRENYKIISNLNEKDKYDIYGFGANVDGKFEECFNLNMSDNPSITGIENIISQYKKAVKSVSFSGGTYFAPVIDKINDIMKNNIDDNFRYHILVIISDGEIDDLKSTIDSIIESSKYPLSIIIIGVGDIVCDDMKTLNGEDGKLISSDGEILKKDIVQYVHFNDYADDMNKLADAVLKYIPDQVSDYYKNKI